MTSAGLDLDAIDRLTGGEIGTFDMTCHFCSAFQAERLNKAPWLWSRRKPITGSIAETYLRTKRGTTALRVTVEKRKVDLTKPGALQADRWRFPR
jgi:hypothetical protein